MEGAAGVFGSTLAARTTRVPDGSRQFASDYKNVPDWSRNPALETDKFTSTTTYDALNRAATVTRRRSPQNTYRGKKQYES